jgi:transcriptional regulator with XRE-family HTH domain
MGRDSKAVRTEFARRFGAHIKEIRLKKGLTKAEFARKLNMDSSHASRLENPASVPDLLMVNRIAEALGMELSELLKDFEA